MRLCIQVSLLTLPTRLRVTMRCVTKPEFGEVSDRVGL
jgi:hypothetical protein